MAMLWLYLIISVLNVNFNKCHQTKFRQNTPEELGANGLMFGKLAMLEESWPAPDNCNSGCKWAS